MSKKEVYGVKFPAAPPPIDVSHLTEEERKKIKDVLERQKALENETASIQR